MTTRIPGRWRVPAALILLSAIPVAAGAFRTVQLTAGAEITADNARFFDAPVPVLLHIVGASVYCVLGAFQFVRGGGLHRVAGRVLVPCGLVAALSGLWMTVFYPHPAGLLTAFRIGFGTLMLVALVLGYAAVRRRRYALHRAWMIRAYAVAAGAGSQAVIIGPWLALAGEPDETTNALLMAAAWVINLAVAERIIRNPARRRVPARAALT